MSIVTPETSSESPDPSDLPVATDPMAAAPGRPTAAPSSQATLPTRSSWLRFGLPIAVVGLGAAAAFLLVDRGDAAAPATEPVTLRAVEVEQRDLIEYSDLDGTLGYATTVSAPAGSAGTVTAIVDDGDTLSRGQTAFEVDAVPVVVFYGDVPLYRSLGEGAEGDDVALLERNLASLGYHATEDDAGEEVDTGFAVDGVFDSATTAAVERWQADIGRAETGVVEPSQVIVIGGPSIATSLSAEVGDRVQDTSPVLTLNQVGSEVGYHTDHGGEVELVVTAGAVEDGSVLYTVDDLPVVALVVDPADDVDFDRDLFEGVADGADVQALEETLLGLGYDADGDLDIDEEFDDDTTEALTEWQEDLQDQWEDVETDGVFALDDYVVVDPGTRVDAVTARESENVARGSELFTTTSTASSRIVTTSIAVADQDQLVEGQQVEVEFPDGAIVVGTVERVATSSTVDPTNPDADPELAVEIVLVSVPESAASFAGLDVEVRLVDEIATAAIVVPVGALVATADGYAVEVVSGGSTQFVAVEPGMFADGFVEVSGLEPGTAVVVP